MEALPAPMKIRRLTLTLLALTACSETRTAASAPDEPPRDEIHGRVLRADGTPVAGAQVSLTRMDGLAPPQRELVVGIDPSGVLVASAVSAPDGSFQFAGPLRGNHRLDVNIGTAKEHRFGVPAGEFAEIVLGAGCRIEGRLICEDHKEEAFTGEVWLTENHDSGPHLLSAPIQPDGTFIFESLPPYQYFLTTHLPAHFSYSSMGGVRFAQWGETVPVEVHVRQGMLIEGRVLAQETSVPISGAKIWIQYGSGLAQLTDAEGRFRFQESRPYDSQFPYHDSDTLMAMAPGYGRGSVTTDWKEEAVIRLPAKVVLPLSITGTLLNAQGQRIAGARLRLSPGWRDSESGPALQFGTTDAEGKFSIPWSPSYEAELQIETADALFFLALGNVQSEGALGEIRLPVLAVWNVVLRDPAGQPVAGALLSRERGRLQGMTSRSDRDHLPQVEVWEMRTTSDSFGRCQFVTEVNNPVKLAARLGWNSTWKFALPATDGTEQVLTLDNLRRVPCRVLSHDRQPVQEFYLNVVDAEHPMPDFGNSGQGGVPDNMGLFIASAGGMTFIEGSFQREVSLVFTGIVLSSGGFLPQYRRDGVVLDAGPVEIVLPEPAPCTGRVVDVAGQPMAGAILLLIDEGKEEVVANTEADGGFHLLLLPGKFYALVAVDESDRRSEPVAVMPGVKDLVLRIKE